MSYTLDIFFYFKDDPGLGIYKTRDIFKIYASYLPRVHEYAFIEKLRGRKRKQEKPYIIFFSRSRIKRKFISTGMVCFVKLDEEMFRVKRAETLQHNGLNY